MGGAVAKTHAQTATIESEHVACAGNRWRACLQRSAGSKTMEKRKSTSVSYASFVMVRDDEGSV
jgi:hypothetical protein